MAKFGSSNERRWDSRTWALTLGRLFGIRIRLHWLFPLLFFQAIVTYYPAVQFALISTTILLLIVLLHEFGHCFGCRAVGGQADDILMWPLGGLATATPPNRPYETLVTVLAGPAVNAFILVLLLPILYWQGKLGWSTFNPFEYGLAINLSLVFKLNLLILAFNVCLPFYPMDGGRILHCVLWSRIGVYQATLIATSVGMVGGIFLFVLGFYLSGMWSHSYLLLSAIGAIGFADCLRERRQLDLMGQMPDGEFGYDFSQGYTSLEKNAIRSTRSKSALPFAHRISEYFRRRRDRQTALLEAELDRILEKIHEQGLESLSRTEKRTLTQASRKKKTRAD